MRFASSGRPRRSRLRLRARALQLPVWLAVWVAFTPALGRAADAASVVIAQAEAPAEPNDETTPPAPAGSEPQSPPGSSTAPLPGIEVMHVRGSSTQIETEVPSSLTLFDASTIEALGAQDISDLARVTPNVNIVQPGATQATFFVRGVGLSDFSSNAAGAVTIFQDDVSLNAPAIQTGTLFDVEGVEVLRGPQGTGPYRNASAGAIRVRSRRPSGNYTAELRSSFGRYDTHGDKGAREAMIQDYEGAVEAPIVPGWLSTRLAFRLNEADPYKTNGCANAPPIADRQPGIKVCGEGEGSLPFQSGFRSIIPAGLPKYVGDKHNWAARGALRFHPEDSEYDFMLNAHGSRLDQDSTLGQAIGDNPLGGAPNPTLIRYTGTNVAGYVDPDARAEYDRVCGSNRTGTPGNPLACPNRLALIQFAKKIAEGRPLDEKPFRGDYDKIGQTTRDTWGAFLSGEVGVTDDIKISGLTSYDAYERTQDGDTDFTPDVLFEQTQEDEAWQMYHQLMAEGELPFEPIQWNLGVYYLREDLTNDGRFALSAGGSRDETGRPAGFTTTSYDQLLDSAGVWGGFAWDFADDFTLEGGVRYNWERKEFDIDVSQRVFQPEDFSGSQSETWQTPTGQLVLTYHIDADNSVFAKYSRGFKAGHFNALATANVDAPPADEEYNDAWEIGLNTSLLNRMISMRSSFFYYRYENYQVFLFQDSADASEPPVLAILNAKQAENFGAEVEGMILPLMGWTPSIISGLRLTGNFSWLHGEYIDFATERRFPARGATGTFIAPVDYSGKQLQNAPRYKASGTAEWTFDLGRFGYLIPRYDINWSDDTFFDPNEGHGSIDPTGRPALVDYAVGQRAFTLHNVRLAYRAPSSTIEIAGWIRNIEDRVYKNYAFDATSFSRTIINFPGEPRTIGVDISVTF